MAKLIYLNFLILQYNDPKVRVQLCNIVTIFLKKFIYSA